MPKFSADYVFPVTAPPLKNGVITTDDSGKIIEISTRDQHRGGDLKIYQGVIIPGFINTHCHLELSHLHGRIARHTGLSEFVMHINKLRHVSEEEIMEAIVAADDAMYRNGIVAVGDISNLPISLPVKSGSPIDYYTFIETLDVFIKEKTTEVIEKANRISETINHKNKSIVPHAPYTVSAGLLRLINAANDHSKVISVHNQETPEENDFFRFGTGEIRELYGMLNNPLETFSVTGKNSIHHILSHLKPKKSLILVHNTTSAAGDIQAAKDWDKNVFWATCPIANLYIEDRLPDYDVFISNGATMTIGTDSLASNHQLSILEEIKTILKYFPHLSFETLLKWATINGARALGFEDRLGSLEVGKQPGLLVLDIKESGQLREDTKIERIM